MKTKLDLVVWIAEYAYRKANPNSKMDVPSIVYEQVEKDFLPILELYSDQQNKELREKVKLFSVLEKISQGLRDAQSEIDGLSIDERSEIYYESLIDKTTSRRGDIETAYCAGAGDQQRICNAEIQRLTKELDEVKTSHYQKLDAQLVKDVERLTKEVERLNTCVKTYSDMSLRAQEQILEMEKQIGNWKVLSELNSKESISKGLEIVRLTKEVQNLINERDKIKRIGYANKGAYESIEQNYKREITRLRELLGIKP